MHKGGKCRQCWRQGAVFEPSASELSLCLSSPSLQLRIRKPGSAQAERTAHSQNLILAKKSASLPASAATCRAVGWGFPLGCVHIRYFGGRCSEWHPSLPTALPKSLSAAQRQLILTASHPVSAGEQATSQMHIHHTHTLIHTHIWAHRSIKIYTFDCEKWVWKRYFISLEIEGLSRIIEAAGKFPPLAGALFWAHTSSYQPLSLCLKSSQMRNQIPSKWAGMNMKILFFSHMPSGIDKNILNTWLLRKKNTVTKVLFFHYIRKNRNIRKQCSHPCILSPEVTGSFFFFNIHLIDTEY